MKNHSTLIALLIVSNMVIGLIKCFAAEIDKSARNEVYVVNHGWHTGFVVPASAIHKAIPELKQRFEMPHTLNLAGEIMNFIRQRK